MRAAQELGSPISIVRSVVEANDRRKLQMTERILRHLDDPTNKTVAVLGLTFKPNTDDMRNRQA